MSRKRLTLLATNLVGSTVLTTTEAPTGKPTLMPTEGKLYYSEEDALRCIDKFTPLFRAASMMITKTFMGAEMMMFLKMTADYEKYKDKIPTHLFNLGGAEVFIALDEETPEAYGKRISEHLFALRAGERACMLLVVKYFRNRHPKLAHLFDSVLTVTDFKSIGAIEDPDVGKLSRTAAEKPKLTHVPKRMPDGTYDASKMVPCDEDGEEIPEIDVRSVPVGSIRAAVTAAIGAASKIHVVGDKGMRAVLSHDGKSFDLDIDHE